MPFKKGNSGNVNGRPKGSRNKTCEELRQFISDFLEQKFEDVINDFDKLEPKERIKAFIDLLQYTVPKLQAISGFENLQIKVGKDLADETYE